jgi:hypothetical protein
MQQNAEHKKNLSSLSEASVANGGSSGLQAKTTRMVALFRSIF